MKFTNLEIENFLAISNAKLNLADRGLVLIQGINHDDTSAESNGSGKSSLADALCWCWFGTTARGASGDDVINDKAGKGTRVASTVTDGAITYTATRHRKHKTGKNTLTITMSDGLTETDLTKGTDKLTQEVADRIIGSSLEVFAGSIYAGQERMPDLPAMTDKQLKTLIEEAAGVNMLEAAYREARDSLKTAQTELTSLETRRSLLINNLNSVTDSINHTAAQEKAWEENRSATIQELNKEAVTTINNFRDTEAKIAALNEAAIREELAEVDKRIATVAEEGKKLAELKANVARADSALNQADRAVKQCTLDRDNAKTAFDNVKHKIGCPCDECGRPLTEAELESATKAADRVLEAAAKKLIAAEDELAKANDALHLAVSDHDDFEASMTDLSAETARRGALQAKLDELARLQSDTRALSAEGKRLSAEIKKRTAETNPFAGLKASELMEADRIRKEIDDVDLLLLAQRDVTDIEAEVVKVFAPAGVRAHILDEVTPFLNGQTSKYLGTLSDGNIEAVWTTLTPDSKGDLKEKFSIDVTNSVGGKTFKVISGGEKRKVRIATALALQDLVATRASKPIDLFIGDEIDDALDPAGLERLTQILEEKARERGSVFVISHADLKDHIRQVITVEKRGGETVVTETAGY